MNELNSIIMYSSLVSFAMVSFALVGYFMIYEEEVIEEEFQVVYEESNNEESPISEVRVHGKHER